MSKKKPVEIQVGFDFSKNCFIFSLESSFRNPFYEGDIDSFGRFLQQRFPRNGSVPSFCLRPNRTDFGKDASLYDCLSGMTWKVGASYERASNCNQ